MSPNQFGIETVADATTGYKMLGYKDVNNNLRKILCKDQNAVVLNLTVAGNASVAGPLTATGDTFVENMHIHEDTTAQGNIETTGNFNINGTGGYFINGVPLVTGGEGKVGPGTIGTIPVFVTDTTTIGDSFVAQDPNGITVNSHNNVQGSHIYSNVYADTSNSAASVTVHGQNQDGNDLELQLISFGGNYFPGSSQGPDGATNDNGVQIQSVGADWLDILTVNQQAKGHLSNRWSTKLTWDSTGVGLKNQNPAGVFHPIEHFNLNGAYGQVGINCNVGPYAGYANSITDVGMVEYRDTIRTTQYGDPILQFGFIPEENQGLVGWFDVNLYDGNNGESYYGHFSIRFFNEGAHSITKDYGDSMYLNLTDSGDGLRLILTNSGAPHYSPIFNIKVNSAGGTFGYYEVDYHLFLRKIVFPIVPV
jgi:hypothetical protein